MHFQKYFSKMSNSNIITEPDKENEVFIISKLDYLQKMKAIISDDSYYQELGKKTREDSLSKYLRKLRRDEIIADVTFHNCNILPA